MTGNLLWVETFTVPLSTRGLASQTVDAMLRQIAVWDRIVGWNDRNHLKSYFPRRADRRLATIQRRSDIKLIRRNCYWSTAHPCTTRFGWDPADYYYRYVSRALELVKRIVNEPAWKLCLADGPTGHLDLIDELTAIDEQAWQLQSACAKLAPINRALELVPIADTLRDRVEQLADYARQISELSQNIRVTSLTDQADDVLAQLYPFAYLNTQHIDGPMTAARSRLRAWVELTRARGIEPR